MECETLCNMKHNRIWNIVEYRTAQQECDKTFNRSFNDYNDGWKK